MDRLGNICTVYLVMVGIVFVVVFQVQEVGNKGERGDLELRQKSSLPQQGVSDDG